LTVGFALFPVNYLLSHYGWLTPGETIGVFEVLSVATKSLYVAVIMDVHLEMLIQTQRALTEEQRANDARRAFLKYIFHEVRTPLNSLTMGIELLQRSDDLKGTDRESLLMMKGASDFMCDTLNDVLSLQKIEEGKLELEMNPFSLEETITKVFFTFSGSAMSKGIRLVKLVAEDVPRSLIGDRYRVEHTISNLVSNAVKFSSHNSIVRVLAEVESIGSKKAGFEDGQPPALVKVSVQDQGPGISEENQKKLFKNYVQIRPGQLQQGQGSGLGLSLCKQIVTLHGGTIGVSSVEGQGSTFFFSIPFTVHDSSSEVSMASYHQLHPQQETAEEVAPTLSVMVVDGVCYVKLRYVISC
jgi:two-component system sensor histidine kinase BarA